VRGSIPLFWEQK